MPPYSSLVVHTLSEFGPLGSISARSHLAICPNEGRRSFGGAAPRLVPGVGSGGLRSSQFTVHRSPRSRITGPSAEHGSPTAPAGVRRSPRHAAASPGNPRDRLLPCSSDDWRTGAAPHRWEVA